MSDIDELDHYRDGIIFEPQEGKIECSCCGKIIEERYAIQCDGCDEKLCNSCDVIKDCGYHLSRECLADLFSEAEDLEKLKKAVEEAIEVAEDTNNAVFRLGLVRGCLKAALKQIKD